MSIKQGRDEDSINQSYKRSNDFARGFCSPTMMRYLDVLLSEEYGETFYDGMIVGANFSRGKPSGPGSPAICGLEMRILGHLHDRGIILSFGNIFHYSSRGGLIINTPDIHWIEFDECSGGRLCRIHFTSSDEIIEVGFKDLAFDVVNFDGVVEGLDFFRVG